jgi:hypothetical protein
MRASISKRRPHPVVALFMLLLSQNLVMAQFDPPRIATSLRHFDMGNNTEVDLKDRLYLLTKGVEANINEGDALSVYREVSHTAPFADFYWLYECHGFL